MAGRSAPRESCCATGTDRWGRPVDALPGPDGALYVSDDTAGAVYRITLPG
jgi:glucose/arabinose dehydrogenase